MLLTFLATPASAQAQTPKFDGRGWKVGNQQRNTQQVLTEYVLPGQTVDNWKELVTSTVFLQAVPMARLVDRIHASMAQGGPSLVWNMISQDDKTAVYEFWDQGCGGFEATHELDRVRIEPSGMYRLAYAVKTKAPLPEAKRKEWLAIFGQTPPAEGLVGGTSSTSAPARPSAGAAGASTAKTFSTEELAAGVRKSGWPCPTGVKSEMKGQTPGPSGPLALWTLDCSNGQRFSIMIDPSGAITSFPAQP
jgi:hypothetical protein